MCRSFGAARGRARVQWAASWPTSSGRTRAAEKALLTALRKQTQSARKIPAIEQGGVTGKT